MVAKKKKYHAPHKAKDSLSLVISNEVKPLFYVFVNDPKWQISDKVPSLYYVRVFWGFLDPPRPPT